MSMSLGMLLIEGNHLNRLKEIFEDFGYIDTGKDRVVHSSHDLPECYEEVISRTRERKVAYFSQGWTAIYNAMTMLVYEDICTSVARKLNSRLFGMVCEGVSGSYGFWMYNPEKQRGFLSEEGEVTEDFGEPLPGEKAINKQDIFEDDVLALMKSLGFDYEQSFQGEHFVIKELDCPEPAGEEASAKKPWWKFW